MKCHLLECTPPPQSSGRPPPRGCRSGSGLPASRSWLGRRPGRGSHRPGCAARRPRWVCGQVRLLGGERFLRSPSLRGWGPCHHAVSPALCPIPGFCSPPARNRKQRSAGFQMPEKLRESPGHGRGRGWSPSGVLWTAGTGVCPGESQQTAARRPRGRGGRCAGRPSRSGSQALQAGFPRRSLPEPFSPPAVAGRDTLLRPCRAVPSPARPWHRTVLAKPFDPAESQLPPRSRGLGWGSRPRCPSRAQPGASPGCTRWPFVVALL